MTLKSPLARVLGLGPAKDGISHWWWQRLTAIALAPLGLWFVYSVLWSLSADYNTVMQWLRSPVQAALLIVLSITIFWHGFLGLQVVIEDYVHTEWTKITSLIFLKMIMALLLVITVLMILRVFLGT